MAEFVQDKVHNGTLVDDFSNKLIDSDNLPEQWVLANSPLAVFTVLVYLVTIKVGIRWMDKRPAYDLTLILRLYNIFQVFFNLYLILIGYLYNYGVTYTVLSNSCTSHISGDARYTFMYYFWGFLVLKITDLFDTIFMVLRKKNSHISFLHVYHHSGMVVFTWITLRYTKAHQGAFPALVNLVVHVVMYTYYFLATFGPVTQKYLWWKRHLTKLQLGQFSVILLYLGVLYYIECPVSRIFSYIWIFNTAVVFGLFINFYIKTYIMKKEKSS